MPVVPLRGVAPLSTRLDPPAGSRVRREVGLEDAVRSAGLSLGLLRVGFARPEPDHGAAGALAEWRRAGYAGELDYLHQPAERHDPARLLASVRTVVVAAMPHPRRPPPRADGSAWIARYALTDDYHEVLRSRLQALAARIADLAGRPIQSRICVDSSPLLEHAFAARSGLGFTGRNTLTIVPSLGSYVLLGELLIDLALTPDPPAVSRCGRCTRCLDSCPTGALLAPYLLDARRCISYLTIELRGPIPRDLRPLMGRWVFGCDRCQEVCPYNSSSHREPPVDPRPRPELATADLLSLLELGSKAHRRLVRGTVLHRVSRPRLARNAAVALGNLAAPAVLPALIRALDTGSSPLVRGHVAWAIGRTLAAISQDPRESTVTAALETQHLAEASLDRAQASDPDPFVREEAALARMESPCQRPPLTAGVRRSAEP